MMDNSAYITCPLNIAALIVSGGCGTRFATGAPKQYTLLHHQPVLSWSLNAFAFSPHITSIQVVIRPEDQHLYEQALAAHKTSLSSKDTSTALLPPVLGGQYRHESVYRGLQALAPTLPDYVMIHDAARPGLSQDLLHRMVSHLAPDTGIAPYLTIPDLLRMKQGDDPYTDVERTDYIRVQTPQAFPFALFYACYTKFMETGGIAGDDIFVFQKYGYATQYILGCPFNIKMTTPEDHAMLEKVLG